jgi:hypothetical protein
MSLIVNGVEIETVYHNIVEIETVIQNTINVFEKITGPTPIASDGGVDWYGEVTGAELITGVQLASLIGLTTGYTLLPDSGWLHVGLDGTELLIAKRPFIFSISWEQINAVNAVYGNRIVNIQGQDYKIRLMKGANSDPTISTQGFDDASTHGSEWNRIFYRLTENVYLDDQNTKASEEPFIHLAQYSEEDLKLGGVIAEGDASWCQETAGTDNRLLRGWSGVSNSYSFYNKNWINPEYGWRPVLEKV